MQPLNNDMDELMRRAAADYPVIPQGADWQKVAQQLEATVMVAPQEGHGGLKKLLLLLPLLLASFVCDRFLEYEYGLLKKLDAADPESAIGADLPPATNSHKTAGNQPLDNRQQKNSAVYEPVPEAAVVKTNGNAERQLLPGTMDILNREGVALKEQSEIEKANAQRTSLLVASHNPMAMPNAQNIQPRSLAVIPVIPVSRPKKAAAEKKETFYASVLMGPDLTRVKDQKTDQSGYSVGILAGYNFTRKWAVEAGVFWDKKNYYSTGEYFKTDKINLPQHSEIIQVDGYCNMFELPLNIRYNVIQNRRNNFYASAGVSSYLMLKEDYNYVYRRYNEDYEGNKVYTNESKDWFSVANAAIGYEHRLGAKTKIRIEPYIRVPLKGVGIGSLPLSSTGILVGITYPIH